MTSHSDIEKIANILKVLGDPNRLSIVMAIGKGSRSVTEIITDTGLSQTLVSFHLKALRNAAIAKTERGGPFIYYSLSDPGLMDILDDLTRTADFLELKVGKKSLSNLGGLAKQRK
jgi:ArsR family transcriptional regulator